MADKKPNRLVLPPQPTLKDFQKYASLLVEERGFEGATITISIWKKLLEKKRRKIRKEPGSKLTDPLKLPV